MPTVQRLPYIEPGPLDHLDRYAFEERRVKMVSPESGLGFSDIQRMHSVRRSQSEKRNPIPEWAVNDQLMREVVLRCLENATYTRNVPGSSDADRLAAVRKRAIENAARWHTTNLHRLLARHRTASPCVQRELEIQIQNIDTQITNATRLVEIVLNVVYLSYRLDWNSVQVAEALRIKPPHVRVLLHRMNVIWKRMKDGSAGRPGRRPVAVRMERTATKIKLTTLFRKPTRVKAPKPPKPSKAPKPPKAPKLRRVRRVKMDFKRAYALRDLGWPWGLIALEFDMKSDDSACATAIYQRRKAENDATRRQSTN